MRKTLIVLALLASGFVAAKPTGQSGPLLKPAEDQADAAIWASRFLTRFHYKAVPLDDAMSVKMFDAYFESQDLMREVGYVELTPPIYDLARKHFANRKVGTAFGAGGSQVGLTLEQLLAREQ